MPISAQVVRDRMIQVGLDAEGTDHYRDDIDIIPAINAAIEWMIAVIDFGLSKNKLAGEILQELTYVRIFQASGLSRVYFVDTELGHSVWTIKGVYPEPEIIPSTLLPTTLPDEFTSAYESAAVFVTSDYSSKRLENEEWITNKNNPFEAGNIIYQDCPDMKAYAYRDAAFYVTDEFTVPVLSEIEIRPLIPNQFVGIEYIAFPTYIIGLDDTLQFPETLTNLMYTKALSYVAIKQGDNTTVNQITERDLSTLLTAMIS